MDTRWLQRFEKYIGYDPSGDDSHYENGYLSDENGYSPDTIDNSTLIISGTTTDVDAIGGGIVSEAQEFAKRLESDGRSILRRNICEGHDFQLLTAKQWDLIYKWYGGGPAIERRWVHARCRVL